MPDSSNVHFGHQGRVVIVTGGAQGIGEACVRRFAREGAQVVIADLARETGARFIACDVGDKTQVDALVAQTVAAHGRIDVLVNNAGIFKAADFLDITEADFDAVLRVNLKGAFLMAQAAARAMVQGGTRGAIVHMSSVNGVMAIPTIASYNVSKGGINQLTRVMALAVMTGAPAVLSLFWAAAGLSSSRPERTKQGVRMHSFSVKSQWTSPRPGKFPPSQTGTV